MGFIAVACVNDKRSDQATAGIDQGIVEGAALGATHAPRLAQTYRAMHGFQWGYFEEA